MPGLKKPESGFPHQDNHPTANIKAALVLNSAFIILEIVGGILTNSMAILSDALHDLGDSLSLGLAWYFQNQGHYEKAVEERSIVDDLGEDDEDGISSSI